jgi:hypothetical protein
MSWWVVGVETDAMSFRDFDGLCVLTGLGVLSSLGFQASTSQPQKYLSFLDSHFIFCDSYMCSA